jgi:hypothetical protein
MTTTKKNRVLIVLTSILSIFKLFFFFRRKTSTTGVAFYSLVIAVFFNTSQLSIFLVFNLVLRGRACYSGIDGSFAAYGTLFLVVTPGVTWLYHVIVYGALTLIGSFGS